MERVQIHRVDVTSPLRALSLFASVYTLCLSLHMLYFDHLSARSCFLYDLFLSVSVIQSSSRSTYTETTGTFMVLYLDTTVVFLDIKASSCSRYALAFSSLFSDARSFVSIHEVDIDANSLRWTDLTV